MSEMTHFIDPDRKTSYLLPPPMEDGLPEDHLARFIVEGIEQLDVTRLVQQYAGRGWQIYNRAAPISDVTPSPDLNAFLQEIAEATRETAESIGAKPL